jgi:hypothetical protein
MDNPENRDETYGKGENFGNSNGVEWCYLIFNSVGVAWNVLFTVGFTYGYPYLTPLAFPVITFVH